MEWVFKLLGAFWERFADIPHVWEYQPTAYRITLGAGAAIAGLGLIYFRYWAHDSEAISRRIEIERRIGDLAPRGFHPARGSLGEIPRLPTTNDSVMLVGDPVHLEGSGMIAQQQALVYHDRSIDFLVMVPFQDGAWAHRSRVHFEGSDPRKLFRRDEYKTRMGEAQHLICVGLASRRTSDQSPEDEKLNEDLSRDRTRNLCVYVASAIEDQSRQYWTLALGYAELPATSSVSENSQRSAVVIGASGARPDELQQALAKVIAATQLNNVDLSQYSMSNRPDLHKIRINWDKTQSLEEGAQYDDAE